MDVISHSKATAFALNLLPFAGIAFPWFIAVVRYPGPKQCSSIYQGAVGPKE